MHGVDGHEVGTLTLTLTLTLALALAPAPALALAPGLALTSSTAWTETWKAMRGAEEAAVLEASCSS